MGMGMDRGMDRSSRAELIVISKVEAVCVHRKMAIHNYDMHVNLSHK